MGLRRTPPPGMALPARQPSAPPPEFLTEFPPSPEQPQQAETTPTPARSTPPTHATSVETSPIKEVSPTPSPQLPPLKPPTPKPPRVTPRNSLAGPSSPAETPQQKLITLAKVVNRPPATPQRPTTAGALSNRRSVRRTPGAGRLNPLQPKLTAKLTARSPHAARAFERRAATPGRERRKSGRYPTARATPRDLLRALSRQLAPTTVPFEPTPLPTPVPQKKRSTLGPDRRASDVMFYSDPGHEDEDDDDDDDLPPAPRMSMDLEELQHSSDEDIKPMQEPRFRVPLEDLDNTHHSIEFGRREEPFGNRVSFGIVRDDAFADFDGLNEDGEDLRDETVVIGDESVIAGEEIALEEDTSDDEDGKRMEFVGDGDEDVTMGQGELEFDEGDSYFLPIPPGGLDLDEDEDDGRTLELNGNYDDPTQFDEDDLDLEVVSAEQAGTHEPQLFNAPSKTKPKRKSLPLSRHGHPLPQFPRATIKKMAQTFTGGASISSETLSAIVAASEAFFEQVSDDLATYAGHAGRKTIEDGDVVMLLKRQRQITANKTAFSLAQRHLPRELLQEVRMPLMKPTRAKKRSKQVLEDVEEGEEA